jgi:hypothetical protein
MPIPAPAPAERLLDFSSSFAGGLVFVGVEVVVGAVAVAEALEVEDSVVDAIVAEDDNADEVLVAARRALLSTVHHVGDAVADAPVAFEGCFTSPVSGSTK